MKRIILTGVVLAVVFTACKPAKEKAREQIEKAQKTLVNANTKEINPETAAMLVQAYIDYAGRYPEDTIAPDYLYKAAEVTNGLGDARTAAEYYHQTFERYPKWRKAPVALFMEGFTLDTRLTDYFHAGEVYKKFLIYYPDHKLANDVRFMMDNLGKTDEDLMKALQQRDSLTKAKPQPTAKK